MPQLIWKILPLSGDKNFEEFNTFISNPNNTGGFRLATKEECKKPNVTSLIKLDNFCRSTRRCNFLLHRAEHDPRGDKSGFWLSDQRDSEYQHVCNARGTVSESSKTNIKLSLFVLVKEYSSYSCRWGRQYQSIEKLRNN